jgi:hypothetical protein
LSATRDLPIFPLREPFPSSRIAHYRPLSRSLYFLRAYGAIITFSKYGKRYKAGLYPVGSSHMYVTRGVGLEGGIAPRVRLLARPEITVVDLAQR